MSKQRKQRREREDEDFDPVAELCRYAKGERKSKPQIPITMNLGFTVGQAAGVICHAIDSVPGVHNFKVGFTVGMEKVKIDVRRKQDEYYDECDDEDDDDDREEVPTRAHVRTRDQMFIPPTVNAKFQPIQA